ncbi:MAG: DUF349 domain-containing protein [Chitinophagaceae bacterium]
MRSRLALVEKAEAMRDSTDWGVTAKAYNDLMDEWKKAGQAPAEHNNDLWNRFSAAKTAFFNAKKAHSNEYKNMLDENFKKKQSLIDRAESLKNSTRWKEATEELNQLFEEWKSIGHAGKEHKEHLWEQFISARNISSEEKMRTESAAAKLSKSIKKCIISSCAIPC